MFFCRFEKEFKPSDNRPTNTQAAKAESSKPSVSSTKPVVSQAEILEKLPHHHFRDAEGKWLPKKQWKIAEILKDKTKVQSILSGEASKAFSGTEKITGTVMVRGNIILLAISLG